MTTELLLILLVTLLVFGPKKLPMLATHLGLLIRQINHYKQQATLIGQQQIQQLKLQENQRQAEEADQRYQKQDKNNR